MPGNALDMTMVRRVWIDPGCIACGWCSNLEPDIFIQDQQGTRIAGHERVDGRTDANRKQSPLRSPRQGEAGEFLAFVADGCPVKVIHFA